MSMDLFLFPERSVACPTEILSAIYFNTNTRVNRLLRTEQPPARRNVGISRITLTDRRVDGIGLLANCHHSIETVERHRSMLSLGKTVPSVQQSFTSDVRPSWCNSYCYGPCSCRAPSLDSRSLFVIDRARTHTLPTWDTLIRFPDSGAC